MDATNPGNYRFIFLFAQSIVCSFNNIRYFYNENLSNSGKFYGYKMKFYYLYLFCFPVDLQKSLRLKAGNFCLILSHQPGSYLAANGAGT